MKELLLAGLFLTLLGAAGWALVGASLPPPAARWLPRPGGVKTGDAAPAPAREAAPEALSAPADTEEDDDDEEDGAYSEGCG